MTDTKLLCFSDSSVELLKKLRDIQADRRFLLIHWAKTEQELKQVPDVLTAYLSLKELARNTNLKQINEALRDLHSVFENDKKKRGRPRQDTLRKRVHELRKSGHSWTKIQRELNRETGVERTPGAYRNLLGSRRKADST